ncbi:MAG TPA: hypothetical protein PLI13_04875 [Paracoccus sp. (in: a-proteobacteria)]|nr:hypothetical protein [Paracoccus sp. (in: a-proteobacteria)]
MPRPAHDAAELVRSLLAELPVVECADLLTELLIRVGDLRALTRARNLLTSEIEELILEQYGVHE